MSVNEKIRLIRETKGLTQEQVAEKLGVSPTAYGDFERGDNDPRLSKLQKIAEILEMPLSELIDLSEKGNLTINFSNQENRKSPKSKICISSSNTELKEQLLINELQKKEITMKDRENENLREIIALLKREPT
jgi:transcriptional regulator with XRE-family HTH domain